MFSKLKLKKYLKYFRFNWQEVLPLGWYFYFELGYSRSNNNNKMVEWPGWVYLFRNPAYGHIGRPVPQFRNPSPRVTSSHSAHMPAIVTKGLQMSCTMVIALTRTSILHLPYTFFRKIQAWLNSVEAELTVLALTLNYPLKSKINDVNAHDGTLTPFTTTTVCTYRNINIGK
jgi:hypothetical protein